jgi:hypothetical protein
MAEGSGDSLAARVAWIWIGPIAGRHKIVPENVLLYQIDPGHMKDLVGNATSANSRGCHILDGTDLLLPFLEVQTRAMSPCGLRDGMPRIIAASAPRDIAASSSIDETDLVLLQELASERACEVKGDLLHARQWTAR